MDDICPSRDDAQPHIYNAERYCVLCLAPSPSYQQRVYQAELRLEKWARDYYESEGRIGEDYE